MDVQQLIATTAVEPRPYQERIVGKALEHFTEHQLRAILIESGEELLSEIAADPVIQRVRPKPLSAEGVLQRLRTSLRVREASSPDRRPPPQLRTAPVVWLRARWARS